MNRPQWICTTCKKVIASQPFGNCQDCGGVFREAFPDDLACSRCGASESNRLMDRRRFDRLCEDCIDHFDYWREQAEQSDRVEWCEPCLMSYFAHFEECPHDTHPGNPGRIMVQ